MTAFFLARGLDGAWEPGLGDPTFVGWFTVAAYFAAGSACLGALRKSKANGAALALRVAWLGFTVAMGALGINKQLDLQSLITEVGRTLAHEQGWYENRRAVQVLFIKAIGLTGLAGAVTGGWLLRRFGRDLWLPGLGAAFLLVFITVRASSFHDVDILLGTTLLGARLNWVFELGGIACVGLGAWRYVRAPRRAVHLSRRPRSRS